MIKGNGSYESVDGGERESLRMAETENSSRFAVGGEAKRFEHFPLRKKMLDVIDVTLQALQDLGDDNARESKRLSIRNHSA